MTQLFCVQFQSSLCRSHGERSKGKSGVLIKVVLCCACTAGLTTVARSTPSFRFYQKVNVFHITLKLSLTAIETEIISLKRQHDSHSSSLSVLLVRVQICGDGLCRSRSVISSSSWSFLLFPWLRDGRTKSRWRCVSSRSSRTGLAAKSNQTSACLHETSCI